MMPPGWVAQSFTRSHRPLHADSAPRTSGRLSERSTSSSRIRPSSSPEARNCVSAFVVGEIASDLAAAQQRVVAPPEGHLVDKARIGEADRLAVDGDDALPCD